MARNTPSLQFAANFFLLAAYEIVFFCHYVFCSFLIILYSIYIDIDIFFHTSSQRRPVLPWNCVQFSQEKRQIDGLVHPSLCYYQHSNTDTEQRGSQLSNFYSVVTCKGVLIQQWKSRVNGAKCGSYRLKFDLVLNKRPFYLFAAVWFELI